MPYGQQIETQPSQPLQSYPRARQQGYVYIGYQNPPYPKAQIPIAQGIPSYHEYPPPDLNK